MAGPLKGIKILDLSRVLAGPWTTQILGDMGADVIKVERPGTGDDTRAWGPPYFQDDAGNDTSEAAYFLSANRNKRSIALDFTTPEGKDILLELVQEADVFVENFKVGGLVKYGLDYDSLKDLNPGLIYASITGFGQTGPYAADPGYDFLIQGMGGIMSVTGESDAVTDTGPQKIGVALTDIMTGLYTAIGILGAINHKHQTGNGQHIDVALLDVQVATLANQAMNYLTSGKVPRRMGNAHPNIVPYQSFKTADGHIIITVGNDGQFRRLTKALGHPDMADDPRFATNDQRVQHKSALLSVLSPVLETKSTQAWLAILKAVSVPCGPINTIQQVFDDPHVQSRGMQFMMDHPLGTLPQVATPINYSETPLSYDTAPPTLGQHTDEILSSLNTNNDTQQRD